MTDHCAPPAPGLFRQVWALWVDGKGRTRANAWIAAGFWLLFGGIVWAYFVAAAVSYLQLPPSVANTLGSGGGQAGAVHTAVQAIWVGVFAVLVLLVARGIGGISWAAMGVQRRDGRKLIVGGAASVAVLYVAAMVAAAMLDNVLTTAGGTTRIYPGSHTPGAQLLATDIISTTFSGAIWEELTLLAVPIALFTALVPLDKMTRTGRLAGWAALTVVLLAMRVAIHLEYGWPGAAMVALWAGAAIVLFLLSGTVWPLIIGHALYDTAVFLYTRVPAADHLENWLGIGVVAAGMLLALATATQFRGRLAAAHQRALRADSALTGPRS